MTKTRYWIIEESNLGRPVCQPKDREKIVDFKEICKAIIFFRRDILWIRQDESYNNIWSFIKAAMILVSIRHASQPLVKFRMNAEFITPRRISKECLPLLLNFNKYLTKMAEKELKRPKPEISSELAVRIDSKKTVNLGLYQRPRNSQRPGKDK